jgi:hypothetical protein
MERRIIVGRPKAYSTGRSARLASASAKLTGEMRPMTTDMTDGALRPYFLWDEDTSIDELRVRLGGPDEWDRTRLLGKMLREARDLDVWHFVTPAQVADALPRLGRRLGRRRGFSEFLINGWRQDGII